MNFKISGTATTPSVAYQDGHLKIEGKLFPLDHQDFFSLLNHSLSDYLEKNKSGLEIDMALTLTNSVSKRSIMKVFSALEELSAHGSEINVNWHYKSDNEDIQELGEIIRSRFRLDMKLEEDN